MVCNISAEAKYIYLMASDPSDGTKYIYLTASDPSDGTKYIYLTVSDPSDGAKYIYLMVSDPSDGTKYIYLMVSNPSDGSKRSFWLVQHSFIDHSFAALNSPCSFRQTWRLVSNSFNCLALSDDNSANLQHYFEKRYITESFFFAVSHER